MSGRQLQVPELRLGPPEGGSLLLVPPSPATTTRRRHSWICRWVAIINFLLKFTLLRVEEWIHRRHSNSTSTTLILRTSWVWDCTLKFGFRDLKIVARRFKGESIWQQCRYKSIRLYPCKEQENWYFSSGFYDRLENENTEMGLWIINRVTSECRTDFATLNFFAVFLQKTIPF